MLLWWPQCVGRLAAACLPYSAVSVKSIASQANTVVRAGVEFVLLGRARHSWRQASGEWHQSSCASSSNSASRGCPVNNCATECTPAYQGRAHANSERVPSSPTVVTGSAPHCSAAQPQRCWPSQRRPCPPVQNGPRLLSGRLQSFRNATRCDACTGCKAAEEGIVDGEARCAGLKEQQANISAVQAPHAARCARKQCSAMCCILIYQHSS